MTIGPPIPEIQFDLENSRSKAKVKSTPVSAASCWLISLVFHSRASYRPPSLSFHDNRASHSWDTIWPWKFKAKGTPVSAVSSWLISLGFTSGHPIDSRPFRSMTIGPPIPEIQSDLKNSRSKVKVKGQGQRYPSQHSIQLTHFLFVSHQLDQPFLRYGKYNVRLQKTNLNFTQKSLKKNSGKHDKGDIPT